MTSTRLRYGVLVTAALLTAYVCDAVTASVAAGHGIGSAACLLPSGYGLSPSAAEADGVGPVCGVVPAGTRVALTVSLVAFLAVYAVLRSTQTRRRIARRHLRPLVAEAVPGLPAQLADGVRAAHLRKPPELLWDPTDPRASGLVLGSNRHPRLALTGGLVATSVRDPQAFAAVVRHELGHLHHRDVGMSESAVAVGRALVVAVLGPVVVALALARPGPALAVGLVWRLGVLALLTVAARAAVLRGREIEADAWAGTVLREPLARVLAQLPTPRAGVQGLVRLHPSPALRRSVLADPRRGLWLAVGDVAAAAVAAGVALPLVAAVLRATGAAATTLSAGHRAGAAVGVALGLVVGVEALRAASWEGERVSRSRTAALAVAAALGVLAGQLLSVGGSLGQGASTLPSGTLGLADRLWLVGALAAGVVVTSALAVPWAAGRWLRAPVLAPPVLWSAAVLGWTLSWTLSVDAFAARADSTPRIASTFAHLGGIRWVAVALVEDQVAWQLALAGALVALTGLVRADARGWRELARRGATGSAAVVLAGAGAAYAVTLLALRAWLRQSITDPGDRALRMALLSLVAAALLLALIVLAASLRAGSWAASWALVTGVVGGLLLSAVFLGADVSTGQGVDASFVRLVTGVGLGTSLLVAVAVGAVLTVARPRARAPAVSRPLLAVAGLAVAAVAVGATAVLPASTRHGPTTAEQQAAALRLRTDAGTSRPVASPTDPPPLPAAPIGWVAPASKDRWRFTGAGGVLVATNNLAWERAMGSLRMLGGDAREWASATAPDGSTGAVTGVFRFATADDAGQAARLLPTLCGGDDVPVPIGIPGSSGHRCEGLLLDEAAYVASGTSVLYADCMTTTPTACTPADLRALFAWAVVSGPSPDDSGWPDADAVLGPG